MMNLWMRSILISWIDLLQTMETCAMWCIWSLTRMMTTWGLMNAYAAISLAQYAGQTIWRRKWKVRERFVCLQGVHSWGVMLLFHIRNSWNILRMKFQTTVWITIKDTWNGTANNSQKWIKTSGGAQRPLVKTSYINPISQQEMKSSVNVEKHSASSATTSTICHHPAR